jgi:plasmid stabilization system protein ParE
MAVRWSPRAADDLAAIVACIRKDDPEAARRTARDIFERAANCPPSLAGAWQGQNRQREGYARIAAPAISIHSGDRVLSQAVEIVNIIHGAQRWP